MEKNLLFSKFIGEKNMKCMDCGEELILDLDEEEYQVGDVLECEYCGAEMEILQLDPLVLGLINEEK